MADLYPLVAPIVDAQGADTTQMSVQAGFNQLTADVRAALNTITQGTPPTGAAGGDLAGTYPNPTVAQASGLNLFSDSVNTKAQRNGTNAQAFRVYNTFTDASNYELATFDWTTTANSLTIGTAQAGTGSTRSVRLVSSSSIIFTNSSFSPLVSGVNNLGAAGNLWKRLYIDFTNTGTVGAVTINKAAGRVNIAAAGTSVVVTDSLVTAASKVFAVVSTNDATAYIKNVVPAAGSFTITLGAAATAQTSVDFFVVNAD